MQARMKMLLKDVLQLLLKMSKNQNSKLYIVGGFVRDLLLGQDPDDIDFVITDDALYFARKVASHLYGEHTILERASEYSRVTFLFNNKPIHFDFSVIKGQQIEEDLFKRDFTINAMALPLEDYLTQENSLDYIIDPCGGKEDLEKNILRLPDKKSLYNDPVRVIRAARFLNRFNLQTAPGTLSLLKDNSKHISKSLRGKTFLELWQILAMETAHKSLNFLESELNCLSFLFPKTKRMRNIKYDFGSVDDLYSHGVKTVKFLEISLDEMPFPAHISSLIKEKIYASTCGNRTVLQLLKFAALYHDIGKIDITGSVVYRPYPTFNHEFAAIKHISNLLNYLMLNKEEENILLLLVKNHMHPLYIFQQKSILSGTMYRFFSMFKDIMVELMLLGLANFRATNSAAEVKKYICFVNLVLEEFFYGFQGKESLPEILTFDEIICYLNLPLSRNLGVIIEELFTAQINGKIKTKKEAYALIEKKYEQIRNS